MNSLLKRAIMTVLGVVVTLGWWSLRGGGDSNIEQSSRVPSEVWGGGGGKLAIEVSTSVAAKLLISFSENSDEGRELETHQEIMAGTHAWTIDVPRGVGGYIELGALDPEPGDSLRWTIRLNGDVVDEQADELAEPLEDGYAFFLQSYYDDYSTGEISTD